MWRIMSGAFCLLALVAFLGSTGCTTKKADDKKPDSKAKGDEKKAGDGKKLEKDLVGTWEKDKDSKVVYTFKEGGEYEYQGGDLKLKGKWKAVDDKNVELNFTLTAEQVKLMKPIFDTMKEGIDTLNKGLKTAADASFGMIKFEAIPAPEAPKEGENTWRENVTVSGTTAKISGVEYKKK